MRFNNEDRNTVEVYDANGILIPGAVSGDTDTGLVTRHDLDAVGTPRADANGNIIHIVERHPAPLRLKQIEPGKKQYKGIVADQQQAGGVFPLPEGIIASDVRNYMDNNPITVYPAYRVVEVTPTENWQVPPEVWEGKKEGVSVEVELVGQPVEVDKDKLREIMDKYLNLLTRYLSLRG